MSDLRPLEERLRDGTTVRMFESGFFEWFSRVHPATPFVAWLPVVAFLLVRSAQREELTAYAIAGLFLAGVTGWTLTEYLLHRFVFHWVGQGPLGRRLHFLLHGVHHDYPRDQDRLVMPPGFSVPLGVVFYVLFRGLFGPAVGEAAFAGLVTGYLWYDGTHYALHHFQLRSRAGRWLRRHHLHHHFSDPDGGFGVSTPLWDVVFRTLPRNSLEVRRAQPRPSNPAAEA